MIRLLNSLECRRRIKKAFSMMSVVGCVWQAEGRREYDVLDEGGGSEQEGRVTRGVESEIDE